VKKSFTLIEILVVIVILGILATIATKILIRVYENYYYSREFNKLLFKSDLALNIISSKLSNRIKNSVIAVKCNVENDNCIKGIVDDFNSLGVIDSKNENEYKILEWIGEDVYAKRGMWSDRLKRVQFGYSGFVDLKMTDILGNDEYNITTPDSNFSIVKIIDSNWTLSWGIEGDVFNKNYTVLVFSGSDDRGDFLDINHSYGYYQNLDKNNSATRVFKIIGFRDDANKNVIQVKAIDESNSSSVYEKYYLVNSAYAIVPVANRDEKGNIIDYNLTLFFNYYPWNGQSFKDGNSSLLVSNVTQFKFKEQNGVIRILICVDAPKIKIDNEPITVCKEKVVF